MKRGRVIHSIGMGMMPLVTTMVKDAAPRKLGQNAAKLAMAHHGLAAHQRHVQRLMPVDKAQHAVHQIVAALVAQFAQRDFAAQVVIAIRRSSPGSAAGTRA